MTDGNFCIDARLLGTQRHLVKTGTAFRWTPDVPPEHWHVSGDVKPSSVRCLDTALRLDCKSLDLSPEARWTTACDTVFSGSLGTGETYPWERIMPRHAHRAFLKGLVGKVEESIGGLDTNYYESTWVPSSSVFGLKAARLDTVRWAARLATDENNRHVLETFAPLGGSVMPPVYNRFGTRTGRLTVASGPQILTLKREYRDIITSEYGDKGSVVALDCNALEARVLLYEAGGLCPADDLYAHLAATLFEIPLDRKVVKGAVISEMFGMSTKKLADALGMPVDDVRLFVKTVKKHLGIKKLLAKLRAEHTSCGWIRNRHGRKLIVPDPADHVLVNTFAQSTGVDVALLMFNGVLELARDVAPSVRPLYLLHDAIVVDVLNAELASLAGVPIKIRVNGFEQEFVIRAQAFCPTGA